MNRPKTDFPRLMFPVAVAVFFIWLGIRLLGRGTATGTLIGYANIVFFASLLAFVGFRVLANRFKK